MICQDLKIIDNDEMLNTLIVKKATKYSNTFQKDIEVETIEKYIYKKDNGAFKNINRESPKLKCVFKLHTDKKSSFVEVYDNKGNDIFKGNYLWANHSEKSYIDFIKVLKRLHDFMSVIKNFS